MLKSLNLFVVEKNRILGLYANGYIVEDEIQSNWSFETLINEIGGVKGTGKFVDSSISSC